MPPNTLSARLKALEAMALSNGGSTPTTLRARNIS
jgi:hypothetical protein